MKTEVLAELSAYYDGLDIGIIIVDEALSVLFTNRWIKDHLPENTEGISHLRELYGEHDMSFIHYIVSKTVNYNAPHILSQAFHSWIVPLPDRRFPDGFMRQGGRIIPFSPKNRQEKYALIQIRDNSETVLRVQGMKLSQQRLSEKKDELEKEISERIQAENALRENFNFLQTLIDAIPNPLFYKDTAGYYLGCNKAFERLTGIPCADTIGKNVFELYPKNLARTYHESDEELLKRNGIYVFESEFPDKDEKKRDLLCYKAVYRDINGQTAGIVGMSVDITEHKKTEAALREARDMAESASKAKSEFLAKMSHELRTPLNSIMGFAQLLQMNDNLTEWQNDRLAIIEKSGQHLLDIINNLLDLSKVETGHSKITPTSFCLPVFLRQISEIFQIQASKKGIAFHEDFDPGLPEMFCADETKLRQILFNIIGNAVKFTHTGEVLFSAVNCAEGIRFRISDTGIGISSDNIEKIFLPFHQIHDRYRFVEGTGLGLSISHSFLTLMGSQLRVSSIPDKGSSFFFTLPFYDDPGSHQSCYRKIIGADSSENQNSAIGRDVTVLIADDILLNREVLKETLIHMGISVLESENGRDCVEKAKKYKPDLILMDIRMPETDGIAAAKEILNIRECKNIPIIAVSASVGREAKEECLRLGMAAFLEKPYSMEALHLLLLKHLPAEKKSVMEHAGADMPEKHGEPVQEMLLPGEEDKKELVRIARIGDVKALKLLLEQTEQKDEKYRAFTQTCRKLLKTYDLEAIIRVCEGKNE